jgi:putative transposase
MVDPNDILSIRHQCDLLGLNRSGFYFEPAGENPLNLELMRRIDEIYTDYPFYGSRRILASLHREKYEVNRKRVQRLMNLMGIEAIYPKPKRKRGGDEHEIYPYLLRNMGISHPDQIWSTDITYIRMRSGFLYLMAIIDWYSRFVITWNVSNTLDGIFCQDALKRALENKRPEFFNTDQGCQFTSKDFTKILKDAGVRISMNGVGRALDNVYIERLWRSVKYEDVYIKDYENVRDAVESIASYFHFYNYIRLHQSLDYRTPSEIYS